MEKSGVFGVCLSRLPPGIADRYMIGGLVLIQLLRVLFRARPAVHHTPPPIFCRLHYPARHHRVNPAACGDAPYFVKVLSGSRRPYDLFHRFRVLRGLPPGILLRVLFCRSLPIRASQSHWHSYYTASGCDCALMQD